MGTLLVEQERFAEAIQVYRGGIARLPRDSKFWYSLGFVYQESGLYRAAQEAFEKSSLLLREASQKEPP